MKVAFICSYNSARSQMAEGLLRKLSNGSVDVFSAGVRSIGLHPDAVEAMSEIGIDINDQYSKTLSQLPKDLDVVVTVCDAAATQCPVFPGNVERIHWSVEDPAGRGIEAFRVARDDLRQRIAELLSRGFRG
jgi:arsenate reductase